MKKIIAASVAAVALAASAPFAFAQTTQGDSVLSDIFEMTEPNVSFTEAATIAQREGGQILLMARDEDDNGPAYVVEMVKGDNVTSLVIDGDDGSITSREVMSAEDLEALADEFDSSDEEIEIAEIDLEGFNAEERAVIERFLTEAYGEQ